MLKGVLVNWVMFLIWIDLMFIKGDCKFATTLFWVMHQGAMKTNWK